MVEDILCCVALVGRAHVELTTHRQWIEPELVFAK